jgi:hypothetical protein
MGVATPRSPQFFDTARGGIERLQQPVSRRLVAVETVEDVVTTVKSALGKKSWTQTVDSFEAAAKGRLTPDVARFMTDTKGQLDSVALNLESAMGRLKASGVDDPIEAYVEARLEAIEVGASGRGINVSVFNPRFLEIVRDGRVMGQTSDAGKADVAADIVTFRLEASNLRAVLGEDWKKVVVQTANENVRATATQTYQATLDALRAKYPDFQSVGLGRRGVVGKIAGGEANNDVLATVQWIASEEARTVFKNGVRKHFGNMAGDADEVEAITRRATAESDIVVGVRPTSARAPHGQLACHPMFALPPGHSETRWSSPRCKSQVRLANEMRARNINRPSCHHALRIWCLGAPRAALSYRCFGRAQRGPLVV